MAHDWTNEQDSAITSHASDILVSAAAGSGKTAVLTERLIRKITDASHPLDVDRMLVVTFTEDAAKELKERIRLAVTSAMANAETEGASGVSLKKHLQRQYLKLPSAKISTIHGFCFDLVKSNYDILGLPPKIRVSDEAQSSLLKQQVADAVMDSYYASLPGYDDIDDFVSFADNFVTIQDSSLTEKMIELHETLSSYPSGVEFLSSSALDYEDAIHDFASSRWCDVLLTHIRNIMGFYHSIFCDACEAIGEIEELAPRYLPSFTSLRDTAEKLLHLAEGSDVSGIRLVFAEFSNIDLARGKKVEVDEEIEFFKAKRTEFHTLMKEYKERFFSYSDDAIIEGAKKSSELIMGLFHLISAFDRRYSYEKKRRGIIDFNDMERMAYSLLVKPDGARTPLAEELSTLYDEVCIDEYQDVNSLQDGIFKAITRGTHRFMVGDIKQSIYSFRGAEPEIFAHYRGNADVELINLTHNFRSDRPVIDFVNEVCTSLFVNFGTTVPYNKSDELYFHKNSELALPAEIVVIVDPKKNEDSNLDDSDISDDGEDKEALYVARRINELVNCADAENRVKPSEIAILLRSPKKKARLYEEALAKFGITSKNKEQADLFVNPEVLLLMCILNVIDNPTRDIYLAGALKSPIYNVTLSELSEIRRTYPDISLIDALRRYTSDTGFEKGKFFLSKLDEYRRLANEPVDKLIWYIFCDSGILAYAYKDKENAKSARANLMLLYEKARSFESGSFKGLYSFIRYINDMINSSASIPSPSKSDDSDNVHIMSIHKSKGLQYKYVFMCDSAKRFNNQDETKNIIITKELGVALNYADITGIGSVDTLFRRISSLSVRKKNYDEEIRVLYVGLTRAESKLIVTGTVRNTKSFTSLDICKRYESLGNGYLFMKNSNFLNWILLSQKSVSPQIISADDISSEIEPDNTAPDDVRVIELDTEKIERLRAEYTERFLFEYPALDASRIHAKLSVSELYPTILDDYDDRAKLSESKKTRMRVPRFIDESESRGAAIGTATHQFMQFCDFERLSVENVDGEIKRLTELGFLSPSVGKLVSREAIKRFTESEQFTAIKEAASLRRELRFNVYLNASSFTKQSSESPLKDERVLVQGVIDCLYEDADGKAVLLDYKTDSKPRNMSEAEFEEELILSHCTQLSYYAQACKTLIGKEVDEVVIYSFALGKSIAIPQNRLLKL